jgi:hypothetical protein
MMKPDITLAEVLYEKQQADYEKRKSMFKDISDFDQKRRNMQMNQAILKFALKKQGGGDMIPPTTPFSQFPKNGAPLPFNRPIQPTPG